MELINLTLIMVFLGIIAACAVTFPILFLVQRKKQHKQLLEILKEMNKKDIFTDTKHQDNVYYIEE